MSVRGLVFLLVLLAALTAFSAISLHVAGGGAFEPRTIVAMTLRSTIWLLIAAIAGQVLVRKAPQSPM